ncbi:MAG TPA: rhomboid family intramembrane serine protease [Paracoccaceae bacterium]
MPRPPARRPAPAVLAIMALCCLIEALLQAGDHGLIGGAHWRPWAYQNGAFWAGLLRDWRPNYTAQPYTMFLSYSVLHGGIWHLLGNMIALLGLGAIVTDRAGQRGFLILWLISVVGGGLAFGLLSASPHPMVGASGALFGLVGAWKAWDWQAARRTGRSRRPIILWLGMLAALNLALWVIVAGLLAWETHLGGFIAGWVWAMGRDRFSARPEDQSENQSGGPGAPS